MLALSTDGDWTGFVAFFARGRAESADFTHQQVLDLLAVRDELVEVVRASPLRAESARVLVDVAVANPTFTVKRAATVLGLSLGRASSVIAQQVDLGVLQQVGTSTYNRRYLAPRVFDVLLGRG